MEYHLERLKATFPLAQGQYHDLKRRMLNWANQFSILLFLDSNSYRDKYSRYECALAIGDHDSQGLTDLATAQRWHTQHQDWLFGHICYDYKNELEPKLSSRHSPQIGLPLFYFFCPSIVVYIDKDTTSLTIESLHEQPASIYSAICNYTEEIDKTIPQMSFLQRISRDNYLNTVQKLREHIADGDCYEINFCAEGYCMGQAVNPLNIFNALNAISPAPFAAWYRHDNMYMMCASPERYLRKEYDLVTSQPIKGTIRRGQNEQEDIRLKEALQSNIKERAENVMIVDLVRNDLARSCMKGSVTVDELFGIYSFPQVHQMISTVSGKLEKAGLFKDAILNSFPMGSMTGAPKIKVMQLIDAYEQSCRELFSGTVGYIDPAANFDFNVVIRSLFYNATSSYLSYHTGGAITYDSSPEGEWEEMRLKAWAIEKIFA